MPVRLTQSEIEDLVAEDFPTSRPHANLQTFLSALSPMEAGKARKALLRSWRFANLGSRPLHQHVEIALKQGGKVGSVDTGAYIRFFAKERGLTFDKLPQVAFKYAEHIRADVEANLPPPPPRLFIDSPSALSAMAQLEGDAWLVRQERDAASLRDPHGFYLNREAHKILVGLGDQRLGLQLDDLVPGAGLIEGSEGRFYAVLPDGEITLLDETADDPVFVRAAAGTLRVTGEP